MPGRIGPDATDQRDQTQDSTSRKPASPSGEADAVITLRVLTLRRDGFWYAHCLDLNLVVRRQSLPSALIAIREQIELYLDSANEAGEWDQRVPRPASLSAWLLYYGCSGLEALRRVGTKNLSCTTFRMPFDRNGRLVGA